MVAVKAPLPRALPESHGLCHGTLAAGHARRLTDGRRARRLLPWLLLDIDAAAARGRRDEPTLGRGAHGARAAAEVGAGPRALRRDRNRHGRLRALPDRSGAGPVAQRFATPIAARGENPKSNPISRAPRPAVDGRSGPHACL